MQRSLFAILVCGAVALLAQSTGALVGTVQDGSGAVVPGAAIRAINEGTGQQSAAVSDASGRFSFPRLPVGTYRLEATSSGFRQIVTEGVRLDSDQTVDDLGACVVEASGQSDVPLLLEARLQLDHHRDLLAVQGRHDQLVDHRRVFVRLI